MTESDDYERLVGQNLRRLRQARGLNQEQLAAEVAERGVPFRQQTIAKVEKGTRPLRLREADAITAALGIAVDDLVAEEAVLDLTAMLIHQNRKIAESWEAVIQASKELLFAQAALRHDLDLMKRRKIEIDEHVLNESATYLQVDLVAVAKSIPGLIEGEQAKAKAESAASVEYVRFADMGNDGDTDSETRIHEFDDGQVLRLLAAGSTYRQISDQLEIPERAVEIVALGAFARERARESNRQKNQEELPELRRKVEESHGVVRSEGGGDRG